jgi:hypothetical protein
MTRRPLGRARVGPGACLALLAAAPLPVAAQSRVPGGARQVPRGPEWLLSVDGGAGYESNVRFQLPDGDGDVVRRIRGVGGGILHLGHTTLALDGTGDYASYQKLRDLDRLNYAVAARLVAQPTPRTATHVEASASTSLTPELDQGGVALPLAPLTTVHTRLAAAGLTRRHTPRTQTTLDTRVSQVKFGSSALAGGTDALLNAAVQRRATPAVTVALDVQGGWTTFDQSTYTTQAVAGSWTLARRTFGARLRAGALALQSDAVTAGGVHLLGEGELSQRLGRVLARLRGGRNVAPTRGLGRVLATSHVGAALDRTTTGGTTFRLSADHSSSRDPLGTTLNIATSSVGLDVRRPVLGGYVALGGVFRQRRGLGAAVTGHGLTLSVGRVILP